MLLTKGRPAPSEPWRILEVAIGQAPDVLALRLDKELKRIHEKAVQALIPFKRNINGEPEWIIEHVYVRGANGSLRLLARTPGIDFIRKELADQEWIERLLGFEQTELAHDLQLGQFVRVLTGPCARMCGTISAQNSLTTVTIQLPTKRIRVHTHEKNLQAVSCTAAHQTFFFHSDFFS